MEIQLGPRSKEADGRALGTGRSSTPPSTPTPVEAQEERRADLVAARKAEVERKAERQQDRAERPARRSFGDDLRARRQEQASARVERRAEAAPTSSDSDAGVDEPRTFLSGDEARAEIQPPAGRAGAAAPVAANQPRPTLAPASTPFSTPKAAGATSAPAAADVVPALALPATPAPALAVAPLAPAGEFGWAVQGVDAPVVAESAAPLADASAKAGKEAAASLDARAAAHEPGRVSEILDSKAQDQGATARAVDERSARLAGTRERAADLLRQIGLQLSPQTRTAVVDLHPRELGRIHIRMSVEGGRVRASLRAERPEALEALERHLPELRAELSRAGLEPQELSLSLGFEGRRGGADAGDGRPARAVAPAADLRAATTDELALVARRVARDGGVDTFA